MYWLSLPLFDGHVINLKKVFYYQTAHIALLGRVQFVCMLIMLRDLIIGVS